MHPRGRRTRAGSDRHLGRKDGSDKDGGVGDGMPSAPSAAPATELVRRRQHLQARKIGGRAAGWWSGTNGNGARRDRPVSQAMANNASDTVLAKLSLGVAQCSRLARRCNSTVLYCTPSCAPRPCCTVPATQSATRATGDTLRRKVSPRRPVRWAVKVPPHAARSFGYVGSGTKENPLRVSQVVHATRPAAPAGLKGCPA